MASTSVKISEARISPATAKSVLLVCPRCSTECECVFPYLATSEDKIRIRHQVMNMHARLCPAGEAEITVVYPIAFPRA
jgi:hypothetical protein